MTLAQPLQWSIFAIDVAAVPAAARRVRRPVLVVSRESANAVLPVVTVLPLSTRRKGRRIYPNEVLLPSTASGLHKPAPAPMVSLIWESSESLWSITAEIPPWA